MSLAKKLALWFSGGIAAIILLLAGVFYVQLTSNTEDTVVRNMSELMAYCASAVKQSLYINDLPSDSVGFTETAKSTAEELNGMLGCGIACYDTKGSLIFSTYSTDTENEKEMRDLFYAVEGKNAYTFVRYDRTFTAYFSFPIRSGGESIGIMRLQVDYTELYRSNRGTFTTMIGGSAAVLTIAAVILAFALMRIVHPVKKLSEELKRTTLHPERAETLPVTGRDEIGLLTAQYNKMALTIRSQMSTIKTERDRLSKTLEYKKAFYDNLTHELKTPLTIILGYAEMMEQTDFEDVDFVKKGTGEIITESKRLRDMVTALLESSRDETATIKLERVDLLELISGVAASMDIKAQRYGSSIKTELCEAAVEGSRERLRQLYVNLIDNAIKYGRPGESVCIKMKKNSGCIEVSVINRIEDGCHLENIDKIFLPFYRSRDLKVREEGSVGLGLSICRNIADEHGGTISAEEREQTVCFKTVFPIYGGRRDERP